MHCTVSDTVLICICLMDTVLIFLGGHWQTIQKRKDLFWVMIFDVLGQSVVPGLHVLGQHTMAAGDCPPHEARKQEAGKR